MKKYFLLLITFVALSKLSTYAQAPSDSVLNKYHTRSSQEKYEVIYSFLNSFYKNDSLLIKKSLYLIADSKKQNYYSGVIIQMCSLLGGCTASMIIQMH